MVRFADFGSVLRRSIATPRFFGLLVSQRTRLSDSIKHFAYFAGVGILTHFDFSPKGRNDRGSGRAAVPCCAFERSRTRLPERTASARIAALRAQAENFTLEKIRSFRLQEKRSDGRALSGLRVQGSLVSESFCVRVPNWESKNNLVREMTPLQIEHFFCMSPTFCVFLLTGFSHPTILRFQIRGNVVAPGGPGRGC